MNSSLIIEVLMFYQIVLFVWQFALDLAAVRGMTDDEKHLEIMLLRQQLRIVERKQEREPQDPTLAKGCRVKKVILRQFELN